LSVSCAFFVRRFSANACRDASVAGEHVLKTFVLDHLERQLQTVHQTNGWRVGKRRCQPLHVVHVKEGAR
jgi:hypothetical protein